MTVIQPDVFRTADLQNSDLIVDGIYEGHRRGNAGDDPLHDLLGVSNQGGFRILGRRESPRLIVLTTSLSNRDWPDFLDQETGRLTYYGDNQKPGRELHDTARYGNHLLKLIFELAHSGVEGRRRVPPILVFASAGTYRDVRFLGMAVPGERGLPFTEDLIAIWKSTRGQRFQNYRAVFTILNIPKIERQWINDLRASTASNSNLDPRPWLNWRDFGTYQPLKAPKTVEYRSRSEQEVVNNNHRTIIELIVKTFKDNPIRFEHCAGRISEMLLERVTRMEITRPSRDGGRDGFGKFRVGGPSNGVEVEFALEAKCYSKGRPVGVKEMSRLISRLRHRQFGVLVTTSFVGTQAYKEIKDDGHPIVIVAARDIAEILERNGLGGKLELASWLSQF